MRTREMEMQFLKIHFDQKDLRDSIPILIKKLGIGRRIYSRCRV